MNKTNLSEKQKNLLIFIAEFKNQHQRIPTIYEMAEFMKTTVPAVHVKLESIWRRGIRYE